MSRAPRDDFYVFMWTFSADLFTKGPQAARKALDRFRQMACNGATCIATFVKPDDYKRSIARMGLPPITFPAPELNVSPFAENRFPFYLENICRPIYEKWEKSKPLFREQYETFSRTGDPKVFIHPNCPNNPDIFGAVVDRIDVVMKEVAPVRDLCLLYDLRDEPSITSFLLASDLCFCEHCLARMRTWLKEGYGDLAALNAEWGTDFPSWDAVVPLTTEQALGRRQAGDWNFSPWADHREFMNRSFVRVCQEWSAEIRRHDPDALCGLEGTQCPAVFGGYDFSLMVPAIDWAEPYTFGGALDCFRSFKRRRHVPILKTTGLGGDMKARELFLWSAVFQGGGDAGAIIWNSQRCLNSDSPDLELTDEAVRSEQFLGQFRTGLPRLLQLTDEVSSPVAVHYSQASLNADFITSVPYRMKSVAAWENGNSLAYQTREAWWKLLEDRGLRPVFMSAEQIEAGDLLRRGIKLLILPRSIAVSDAEAAAMKAFVQAGGVLVADSFAGRMDQHCREREVGVLDELFGVRRVERGPYVAGHERASLDHDAPAGQRPRWGGGPLRADLEQIEVGIEPLAPGAPVRVCGCTEMSDSPVGIVREHGKGRAILFNAAPLGYLDARTGPAGGRSYQAFFGEVLARAGVAAELAVLDAANGHPLPGWQVFPFRHGRARYFGLLPDLAATQSTLGAIDATVGESPGRKVTLRFPAAGHVYEARSGRYLGRGETVAETLPPGEAKVYAMMPYRVERLELSLTAGKASAALTTDPGPADEHLFRFDLHDAAGHRLPDGGANVVAKASHADWTPDPPLPPGGKLVCRDVATGVRAEVQL